jgi:hypothetical protein
MLYLLLAGIQVSNESVKLRVFVNAALITTRVEEAVAIAHANRIKISSMPNFEPPRCSLDASLTPRRPVMKDVYNNGKLGHPLPSVVR